MSTKTTTPIALIRAAYSCGRLWGIALKDLAKAKRTDISEAKWDGLTNGDIMAIASQCPVQWNQMLHGKGDIKDLEAAARKGFNLTIGREG